MWWVMDILVFSVFSILFGSWITDRIFLYVYFPYYELKVLRHLVILVVGILSGLYLLFRP